VESAQKPLVSFSDHSRKLLGTVMEKNASHLYEFGPFRLDPAERLLSRGEEPVPLTPKAFDLLVALVSRPSLGERRPSEDAVAG